MLKPYQIYWRVALSNPAASHDWWLWDSFFKKGVYIENKKKLKDTDLIEFDFREPSKEVVKETKKLHEVSEPLILNTDERINNATPNDSGGSKKASGQSYGKGRKLSSVQPISKDLFS